MRHIMAFVRATMAENVIDALALQGCLDFSVSDARRILPGLPSGAYSYSVQLGQGYEPMIRVDLVCLAEDAERFAETIRKASHTGNQGDGMIFFAEIQGAIRIRTGERGEATLRLGHK